MGGFCPPAGTDLTSSSSLRSVAICALHNAVALSNNKMNLIIKSTRQALCFRPPPDSYREGGGSRGQMSEKMWSKILKPEV
jgi:hypothetical protein